MDLADLVDLLGVTGDLREFDCFDDRPFFTFFPLITLELSCDPSSVLGDHCSAMFTMMLRPISHVLDKTTRKFPKAGAQLPKEFPRRVVMVLDHGRQHAHLYAK